MEVYLITGTNSTGDSEFLTRGELSVNGSEVTIRCEFADAYPEALCVLRYNDPYLTVDEYTHSTEFPVTISIKNITLFGKNGIDANPVVVHQGPKGGLLYLYNIVH